MKSLPKIVFSIFISLLIFGSSLFVKTAKAIVPVPPSGRIPCDDPAKNPEFNSLRPYQASPCGDSEKAYYCTNGVVIYEGFHGTSPHQGLQPFDIPQPEKEYAVTISETELPIYGNTEQTANSTTSTDTFNDAQKLNEYVSWYLSGVNGRAEYGDVTNDQIINFSGPIKKLLPSVIQDAERIKIINSASKLTSYGSEEPQSQTTVPVDAKPENHDQIVVCADKQILGINNPYIGSVHPYPCYKGSGAPAKESDIYRLKSWEGILSIPRLISNTIKTSWEKIPGLTGTLIDTLLGQPAWDNKKPPLPWDPQFKDYREYLKAYQEWRGKSCILVPPIYNPIGGNWFTLPVPICVDNPLITNEYADLYQYVPLANNSDKNAKMEIQGVQVTGKGGAEIDISDPKYKIIKEPVNMFAHTQEDYDNLNLLEKTYIPTTCTNGVCKPLESTIDYNTVESGKTDSEDCRITNVRSNEGDNLFTDLSPSEIRIKVSSYRVTQLMCDEPIYSNCGKNRQGCIRKIINWGCSGSVEIRIRSKIKSPFAEEIWKSSTAGSTSEFRKIYPKVEPGAPVSCIADIPGVSNAVYTPTEGTNEITVVSPDGHHTDPAASRIYFPFIGGVYDYFLKGIQTALRPKGYGDPNPISGQYCGNVDCGKLPDLPKASGSCQLGSSSSKVGQIPQSFKDIISAASETYKIPPNLILGVMYGEGAFNSNLYQNEQNVKNWATCVPLPNCNASGNPIKSIVEFYPNYWSNLAKDILPDLQKIDPAKKEANPCNLLDATFALAKDLHDGAGGSPSMNNNFCYGIQMTSTIPNSCSWNNSQYETSIRRWEIGTEYDVDQQKTCLTTPGTCASGISSGSDYTKSLCPGGDNCEKFGNSGNTSHNACVFDVATDGGSGNKK